MKKDTIEKQKAMEKDLDREFIRINLLMLMKRILMWILILVKYTITLINHLKNT